jgi:Ala-tRNA(Pro) deacylase
VTVDAENKLYADLKAKDVAHYVVDHAAVFTVDESSMLHAQLQGAHSKNLFLKASNGVFWLVTVPADIRVDLKALPSVVGCKRPSFGKAEDLLALLGLTPGAVTPLGAINDSDGLVNVVLDRALADAAMVWVHPLRNTASLGISGSNLIEMLKFWNHQPMIVDVPRLD